MWLIRAITRIISYMAKHEEDRAELAETFKAGHSCVADLRDIEARQASSRPRA